jgi:hypothetical protein
MFASLRKPLLSRFAPPSQQITKRSVSRLAFLFKKESIPYISLGIGAFALAFQMLVLHPWHDRLSEQFDHLEKEIDELDKVASQLTTKMERVVEIGKEVKEKERQNMTTSLEILTKIEHTKEKMQLMHQSPTPMD